MYDLFSYDGEEMEEERPPTISLRDYQREALYGNDTFPGIFPALRDGDSAILVLPTGCGKTVVFSEVAREFRASGKKTLILAHRGRLLEQAYDKLVGFSNIPRYDIGFEIGDRRIEGRVPSVVLASKDSLHEKRLLRYDTDQFDLIIVDESHRSIAKTYARIFEHFAAAKRLGVTATPDRLDGQSLKRVFETTAYVYEILDAIKGQYLVPIVQEYVDVSTIDLSQVQVRGGDLSEDQLNKIMCEDENIYRVVEPTLNLAGDRQTLFFCTTIEHAERIAEVANSFRPGCARAISGRDSADEQARKLKDFESGRFQFLANCALLTEGVDIPPIACVAMARPTKSRTLYAQGVGRGTRLLGSTYEQSVRNGKADLLVLDFVGNAGRHTLVTALDVLDGNTDTAVRTRAEKIIRDASKGGKPVSVDRALEEATIQVADEKRQKIKRVGLSYTTTRIDPFTTLGISHRAGRWGGAKATESQREMLLRAGLKEAEIKGLDKGQCSAIISEIIHRSKNELCTYKQARLLTKYGFPGDLSFHTAQRAIDIIAGANWQVSDALRASISDTIQRGQGARVQPTYNDTF